MRLFKSQKEKDLRSTVSFRVSMDEKLKLETVARSKKLDVSTFMRIILGKELSRHKVNLY